MAHEHNLHLSERWLSHLVPCLGPPDQKNEVYRPVGYAVPGSTAIIAQMWCTDTNNYQSFLGSGASAFMPTLLAQVACGGMRDGQCSIPHIGHPPVAGMGTALSHTLGIRPWRGYIGQTLRSFQAGMQSPWLALPREMGRGRHLCFNMVLVGSTLVGCGAVQVVSLS